MTFTLFVFADAAVTRTILIRANVCVSPNALVSTPARSRSSVAEAARVRVSCQLMSAWSAPVPEVRISLTAFAKASVGVDRSNRHRRGKPYSQLSRKCHCSNFLTPESFW